MTRAVASLLARQSVGAATELADNVLKHYASRHRLLTADEEEVLFTKLEKGLAVYATRTPGAAMTPEQEQSLLDVAIVHEVVLRLNQRLVYAIAHKMVRFEAMLPLEDRILEGNIGLMTAIRRFDIGYGYKFSTFATSWVRQAISRAIASQGRTVRIPVHQHDAWVTAQIHQRELAIMLGRQPTVEELAQDMQVDAGSLRTLLRIGSGKMESLNRTIRPDAETELGDILPDESKEKQSIALVEEKDAIRRLFARSNLTIRDKTVLSLRYGIVEESLLDEVVIAKTQSTYRDFVDYMPTTKGLTLDEISKLFGLTRERIRQIEITALERLRQNPIQDV